MTVAHRTLAGRVEVVDLDAVDVNVVDDGDEQDDDEDDVAALLSPVYRRAREALFDFGQTHLAEFGADVGAGATAERARAVEGGDLDPRGGDGR